MVRILALFFLAFTLWGSTPSRADSLKEGDVCVARGKFECAMKAYDLVIATRPSPRAYFQRARLKMTTGDCLGAIEDFRAMREMTNRLWVYGASGEAWCLYKTGDYAQALPYALAAVVLKPDNPHFWDTLVRVVAVRPDLLARPGNPEALRDAVKGHLPEVARILRDKWDAEHWMSIALVLRLTQIAIFEDISGRA